MIFSNVIVVKKTILLTFFSIFFTFLQVLSQSIRINEFSQGANNEKEWVELVVTSSSPVTYTNCVLSFVNISGWIIDDNNGDFSPTNHFTGSGITTGHMRFKNQLPWTSIPVGSIILIYNAADKDIVSSFPADDFLDLNSDCVYVLPSNHASIEYCTTLPAAVGCASRTNYSSCSVSSGTWAGTIALRTEGDAIQVRTPTFSLVHGVVYGRSTSASGCTTTPNLVGSPSAPLITTSTMPTGNFISFNGSSDADYFNSSSWTIGSYSTSTPTPGAFNNSNNQSLIFNTFRGGCTCHRILPLEDDVRVYNQRNLENKVEIIGHTLRSVFTNGRYNQQILIYDQSGRLINSMNVFVNGRLDIDLSKKIVSGVNIIKVLVDNRRQDQFTLKMVK